MKLNEVAQAAVEVKAPGKTPAKGADFPKIFLAGSIEMGKAEPWQTRFVEAFKDKNVTFFNPRRDDWDSSWKQEASNKQFAEQVNWELDRLEEADVIVMYFDPKTQSPITLLELGIHAGNPGLIVCCPDGFWRKGNVEIVCKRNQVKLVNTFEELVAVTKKMLK